MISLLLLNTHKWPGHNFYLQYQYDIQPTSDENKDKYQVGDYLLVQNQIWLRANITIIVKQAVRRIINEILGERGLIKHIFWKEYIAPKNQMWNIRQLIA